ncbi:LamG-like jellyroll fold domain-containing protein [Lacinutrix algicola]|uniref:LamG-like jellyroll fold domain-containing protein n=1 Tax=Lacinutrix algicola TaxID=342954 RepID=UPI0006E17A8F|nr:LamG-like jellyroll fold domain-containing protein [Lacinutrix algicola]
MKIFTFRKKALLVFAFISFFNCFNLAAQCTSRGNNDTSEYISRVQLNTIDNFTTTGTTTIGYSNNTGISTNLTTGSTYSLTITPGFPGTTFAEGYRVWIDYNNNNDFTDSGELVYTQAATTLYPVTATFTVPNTVTAGSKRMRISMKYNGTPTSCEVFDYGEVEDYTVNIIVSNTPEIEIIGNTLNIVDGDISPSITNHTDFGSAIIGNSITRTYTINNLGTLNLNIGTLTISGTNALNFVVTSPPSLIVTPGSSTTFDVTFTPTTVGFKTANISIINNDTNENPFNFDVQGSGTLPLTNGPGGITTNLRLWLKGTEGLAYTDGQGVALWSDQGNGADATVNTSGQEPTYRDNISKNINFNPVVEFDNSFSTYLVDDDYSFDNTSTQFLEGSSGLYTQDIFIVIIPDDTPINNSFGVMDVFCGDSDPTTDVSDTTGIGFGDFTSRITGESISFALDTYDSSDPGDGYAVHDGPSASYSNVGIINARNNSAVTQQELFYNANDIETTQNDVAEFTNVNDSRFWLGRSEGWEAALNARVAEVVTFSSRLSDVDLTDERNRVQSYLAIKYGITLGVNGTSQDYVDSDGNIIWDQSENIGYNFDIAGIGRDDNSNIHQKQSSSVNNATDVTGPTEGILSIGLTHIYNTNNLNKANNIDTLDNKDFLVWGNNNASLDAAPTVISVDISSGIPSLSTPVSFLSMQRIWKVVENGGDIGKVQISIPQNAIRNISPPGSYYMFVSDVPVFDSNAAYKVMKIDGSNLITDYDFDGTKYITFGYAPQIVVERSVYFNGTTDYIDMENALNLNPSGFTISSWIKRDAADSGTASILSKCDEAITEGYDFRILNDNRIQLRWINSNGIKQLASTTSIPDDEWHHVAAIYNGTRIYLYIDGVLDRFANRTAPVSTDQSFHIAAAGKITPTRHFRGNIDEVRIWDTELTQVQLQYIMNQEIENNSNFVSGKIVPTTITKNDVASIPWTNLAGYYPMSIYTYTNTNDESGNNIQGALINLKTVDHQTAPLPYKSAAGTDWDLNSTWANGNVQTIPGNTSIVDNTITVDWNIVETSHNIDLDNASLPSANNNNRSVLSLNVIANKLTLTGDTSANSGNGLTVSHYLKLDGKIDLDGESQLIQTLGSDLDIASSGSLERDQQGTQDLFTYNYWSSPVGATNNTTNNNSYNVPQIFNDGSDPNTPLNINFITNSYNGTPSSPGTPIGIADFWIWKYANLSTNYYNWQHIRSTGSMLAGEGFSMKGVTDTGNNLVLSQNYILEGKPNNGAITLNIDNEKDYLVGNPYASAIDADKFILDNTSTTGAIYYWEHFGGGTHNTGGYQGGYAIYNLSGGIPAVKYNYNAGAPDPTGGNGTKTPGQYIPVAQGFFLTGTADGSTINFNNNQRTFQKENINSVFLRNSSSQSSSNTNNQLDNRLKIRLGFTSADSFNRQLLVTRDSNATELIDFGYDAKNTEEFNTDMFWLVDSEKFSIQGTNVIEAGIVLPLGIKTSNNGINSIKIDALENVPASLEIFVYDTVTNTFHDIRNNQDFSIDLPTGEYLDRFELHFSNNNTLNTEDFETSEIGIQFYFANNNKSIVINNPMLKNITKVEIFNVLGQSIVMYNEFENQDYIKLKTNNISTGSYILEIQTDEGKLSKKVLIE